MAKSEKLSKKLPKRAVNSHPKHAKRMGHKDRAAKRHMANKLAQFQREVKNNAKRDLGLPTPWEEACARRANA